MELISYGKSVLGLKSNHRDYTLLSYGKVNLVSDILQSVPIAIEKDDILGIIDDLSTRQEAEDFINIYEPYTAQSPDYDVFEKVFKTGTVKSDRIKADIETLIINLKSKWGIT